MERYGINVNSASNGVFLPVAKSDRSGDAAIHRGNHGRDYIDQLTKNLQEVDKKAGGDKKKAYLIENVLSETRSDLLNGILKLNGGGKEN